MAFKDTYPFEAFGGKINPLSEIMNTGVMTNGSVFWVKSVSDADFITFQDAVGQSNIFQDVQSALNKCRNYRNDYVMIVSKDNNGTWTNTTNVGSAFIISKANTHVIGVGFGRDSGAQSPTLSGLGTAAAYDTSVMKVLAPGCEIAGLNIIGTAGTTANGTMTNVVSLGTASTGTAHQTWIHDTTIEAIQAAGGGANGTADILATTAGVSYARFDNVYFVNRAAGAKSLNLGVNGTRIEAHFCKFYQAAQATTDSFISTGTGPNDWVLFEKCQFFNPNSGTKNASAITGSITTLTNAVLVDYCTAVGITAFGTDPTCFVTGVQSGTAGAGMHQPGIGITGTAGVVAA